MRKFFTILSLVLLGLLVLTSFKADKASGVEKGVVVWEGCDYVIVETRSFFVLIENYYSKDIRKGDIVYGDLHGYGFENIYNKRTDTEQRVYIENYWTSIRTCFDWLKDNEKCD